MSIVEETILTEDVTEAESVPESPVKEPEDIVEEAIVNEEVTEAQAAPESPVKEEPEAVVKDSSCCRSCSWTRMALQRRT